MEENVCMSTYAFMNKQVWSNDILRVNEENVTNIEMIHGNIDTAEFFISTLNLHMTNGEK